MGNTAYILDDINDSGNGKTVAEFDLIHKNDQTLHHKETSKP